MDNEFYAVNLSALQKGFFCYYEGMIYRGRTKDIIFEFIPEESKPRGVVVLCEGLPSVPQRRELMENLSRLGFFVIFPRYRGTWESSGEFLADSPTRDIADIVSVIKSGSIKELYGSKTILIKNKKTIILGSSFGGTVALAMANNKNISKIIALSPIVDFRSHDNKNEQNLVWLGKFINKAFDEGYRFKNSNWKRMINGQLFNAVSDPPKNKIVIAYDKSDKAIDYKKIEKYSKDNNIKAIILEGLGHVSFSKLNKEMLDLIFKTQ